MCEWMTGGTGLTELQRTSEPHWCRRFRQTFKHAQVCFALLCSAQLSSYTEHPAQNSTTVRRQDRPLLHVTGYTQYTPQLFLFR